MSASQMKLYIRHLCRLLQHRGMFWLWCMCLACSIFASRVMPCCTADTSGDLSWD